jgi:DNA-binding SARP family transcriptional activator
MVTVVGSLGVHPMSRLSLPARRIVAYLAIYGRPVLRPLAAATLWPDLPEEVGRSNLRRAVWSTPSGLINSSGDELILDADTDLAVAECAAERAFSGEELNFGEIRLLSEDILPGWHEEWILPLQDRYRALRVDALEASCRAMIARGKPNLAVLAGTAALAAEPLRESVAQALIEAHLVQGNRYEALRCFRALETCLHRELGVAPDPVLVQKLGLASVA